MTDTACSSCADGALADREPVLAHHGLPAFTSERATRIAEEASALYDAGLWCSEAVLKVINEIAPEPLPASMTRLGSGFCEGMGGAGCSCGALAGGVMAIGLLAGRDDVEDEWEPSFYASAFFHDRFREAFGAACCRTLVRPFGGMDGPGRHEHCAVMTGASAGWIVEIAEQNGWL